MTTSGRTLPFPTQNTKVAIFVGCACVGVIATALYSYGKRRCGSKLSVGPSIVDTPKKEGLEGASLDDKKQSPKPAIVNGPSVSNPAFSTEIEDLIHKYDVPAPRYTSYPTVPYWTTVEKRPEQVTWLECVKRCFDESNDRLGISLYIHLPYCESLCTYCACNKVITKYHNVEEPYIDSLICEWRMYLQSFGSTVKPQLREIHLGGGTPTFFSPENLRKLLKYILETSAIHPQHEFSFEAHPNNTTEAHLQVMYELGFRRLSLGIQDFDPVVQEIVNRIETYETVERVLAVARRIGYEFVNFDLIYGLPKQSLESVRNTITLVGQLRPDRIAYYSYGHVPWAKSQQRKFTEADLPSKAEKRALYELGKSMLLSRGYDDVGMDHFALPGDHLFIAKQKGTLHRNFMGYCTTQTDLLLALGASSISDAKYAYVQNEKSPDDYRKAINEGRLALSKGHFMTKADLLVKRAILDLTCIGRVVLTPELRECLPQEIFGELQEMAREGVVDLSGEPIMSRGCSCEELLAGTVVKLTPVLGRMFVRNVCSLFDVRMRQQKREQPTFSQAI